MANGRLLRIALCGAVLAGALICAGCGRRGQLEEPPVIQAPAATDGTTNQANKPPRRHRSPIKRPTAPFILDPLL